MRVHDEKKSNGVRVDNKKERWVRVHYERESAGVRVNHKKKRAGVRVDP